MSRLDNMRIQGVVAVVAADSVLPIVDAMFDRIVAQLAREPELPVVWIDDGVTSGYFELLAQKLQQFAQERPTVLAENWATLSLNRVQYVECLDMEGVLQQLREMEEQTEQDTVVVVVNLMEMFNAAKLVGFNRAHVLLNEAMLKLRRFTQNGGNTALLLDRSDNHRTRQVMDSYLDRKYRMTRQGVSELL